MFSYGIGMTMSSKKDGLVNIGGFIALNDEEIFRKASNFTIIYEGFITYGGMAGRDMAALAQGLDETTEFPYLESRISQVELWEIFDRIRNSCSETNWRSRCFLRCLKVSSEYQKRRISCTNIGFRNL